MWWAMRTEVLPVRHPDTCEERLTFKSHGERLEMDKRRQLSVFEYHSKFTFSTLDKGGGRGVMEVPERQTVGTKSVCG